MPYAPKTWTTGETITAAELQALENGLAAAAPQLIPTATKTAAYTAAVGDLAVMNVAGGATALTLPTAPADKAQVGFLAVGATAGTPLTVSRGGATDTLGPSGATSVTAVLANEVTVYQYDAANTRWLPVSNVKPQTALDGRFLKTSDVSTSGTPTGDALKAAYVAAPAGGNRVVALGDSLTQWQDNNPANWRRTSWFPFASVMSKGQIAYAKNAGIGGNTTAQMLARFDTDVTPYKPSTVVILGGRNDPDAATTITNLTALVAKVRGIGARPVLGTLPPCNDATTHVPDNTRNTWIRRYSAAQGIPIIDFRSALVDPTNGNYKSAYYNDGTHPNDAGFNAMAQAAITTLSAVLPPYRPHLTSDNTDAANIVGMGALTGTVSQLDAGPWNIPVSSGTRTTAKITDSAIQGDWVQVADTGATGTLYISQPLPAASLVAGHTYALAGRVKFTITSGTPSFQAKVYIGGTEYRAISDWGVAVTDGIYYLEFTPTVGNVAWEIDFSVTAGGYDFRFAQPSVYDLTAMGLA